jgi:hypothetical protein
MTMTYGRYRAARALPQRTQQCEAQYRTVRPQFEQARPSYVVSPASIARSLDSDLRIQTETLRNTLQR